MEEVKGRLLTREQVATKFNVCYRNIERYIKRGLITSVKVGNNIRFNEDDVRKVKRELKKGGVIC